MEGDTGVTSNAMTNVTDESALTVVRSTRVCRNGGSCGGGGDDVSCWCPAEWTGDDCSIHSKHLFSAKTTFDLVSVSGQA